MSTLRMLSFLFLSTTIACASPDTSSGITAAEVVCPPASTLTYANFGEAFVADHCLSCHAAAERPTLATQASVAASARALIGQAVTSTSMPEDESISIEERRMFGEWLACGAP